MKHTKASAVSLARRALSAAMSVLLLLSSFVVTSFAADTGVTYNFEDESTGAFPSGWTSLNGATAKEVFATSEEAHLGFNSIKIIDDNTDLAMDAYGSGSDVAYNPTGGATEFIASFWVKPVSQNAVGCYGLSVMGGETTPLLYTNCKPGDGWVKYTMVFSFNKAPAVLRPRMVTKKANTCVVYYDDISIEPLTEANALAFINEQLAASSYDADHVGAAFASQALSLKGAKADYTSLYMTLAAQMYATKGDLTKTDLQSCVNEANAQASSIVPGVYDFEGDEGGAPANWTLRSPTTPKLAYLTAEAAHSGKTGLKLIDDTPSAATGVQASGLGVYKPTSGKTFVATVWTKFSKLSAEGTYGFGFTADGTYSGATYSTTLIGDEGWHLLATVLSYDKTPASIIPLIASRSTPTGTAYFDDLRIQPLTIDTALPVLRDLLAEKDADSATIGTILSAKELNLANVKLTNINDYIAALRELDKLDDIMLIQSCINEVNVLTSATTETVNLEIPNPGFESVVNGMPENWTLTTNIEGTMYGNSDSSLVRTGDHSVMLMDTLDTTSIGFRSKTTGVPVRPGCDYIARAWVRGSGNADLYLEFNTSTGARSTFVNVTNFPLTSEWQPIEVRGTAGSAAVYADVLVYSNQPNCGVLYFDDVELVEVTSLGILNELTEELKKAQPSADIVFARLGNPSLELVNSPSEAYKDYYVSALKAAMTDGTLTTGTIDSVVGKINKERSAYDKGNVDAAYAALQSLYGAGLSVEVGDADMFALPELPSFVDATISWKAVTTDTNKRAEITGDFVHFLSHPASGKETVTVTITAKSNSVTRDIPLKLVLAPYSANYQLLLDTVATFDIFSYLNGQSPDRITKDIAALPGSMTNNVAVSWQILDTNTMEKSGVISTGGRVSRPAYGMSDVSVTLRAIFTRGMMSCTRDYCVIVPSMTTDAAREMPVINHDFEDEPALKNWVPVLLAGEYQKSDVYAFNGKYALRVNDKKTDALAAIQSQKIAGVKEGYTYSLSALMYTDDELANPTLKLTFLDNEFMPVTSATKSVSYNKIGSGISRWKYATVSSVAPTGAAFVTITLGSASNASHGISYFDTVRLYELPRPENNSFALGTTAWRGDGISSAAGTLTIPSGSTATSAHCYAAPGMRYFLDVTGSNASVTLRFCNASGNVLSEKTTDAHLLYAYAPADTSYAEIVLGAGKTTGVTLTSAPYGTAVADGNLQDSLLADGTGSPWTLTDATVAMDDTGAAVIAVNGEGSALASAIPVLEGKTYVFYADVYGAGKLTVKTVSSTSIDTFEETANGGGWQHVVCKVDAVPTSVGSETLYATLTLSGSGAQFKNVGVKAITNSLPNVSFENLNGANIGTFPFDWHSFGDVAANVASGENEYTLGVKGLAIKSFGEGGVQSALVRGIEGGKSYTASVKARTDAAGFALVLTFFDAEFNTIAVKNTALSGKNWSTFTVTDTAPAGAAYATVSIVSNGTSNGTVYVDEAGLVLSVREIGTNTQLLIDDYMIREMNGVTRSLHQPSKQATDISGWLYGNVIFDEQEGIYKMWYQSSGMSMHYATSTDGETWMLPSLMEYTGRSDNTCIGYNEDGSLRTAMDAPTVFKDLRESDPNKRYKVIIHNGVDSLTNGYYTLFTSPNGYVWNFEKDVLRGYDVVTVAYDEVNDEYIAMIKLGSLGSANKRTFRMTKSKDLYNWTVPVRSFAVAVPEDTQGYLRADGYGSGLYPIGDSYVGFDWRFLINEGTMGGLVDVPLMFSRDLTEDWERPFVETPIIPLGAAGEFDCGMIFTASYPNRMGDETWLYYGGWNGDHASTSRNAKIGIAKWRYNGFVSLDTGAAQGSVTTQPFILQGKKLVLNAEVGGQMTVELLDSAGNVIPGYTATLTPETDGVEAVVAWSNGADLDALAGRTVALRFTSTNSELYSFGFTDSVAAKTRFADVARTDYYFNAVEWAADAGITSGTSAATFSPNLACTRAQTVTFLWRAAGSPEPTSALNPFTDVSADAYYYKAVLWAYEQGITTGVTETTFAPDAIVSRAQVVTFLFRSVKATAGDAGNPFADVADDAYYKDAVLWAADAGITTGTAAGAFSPDEDCTRAQIVTFLYRHFVR